MSQVENLYDANGNLLLQTTRDRFHDETAQGALGNPSTSPKARVSYMASYYDAADRLIKTADIGTNGGSTFTWSSPIPSGSLVTNYGYQADTVQQVALGGTPSGTFTLTVNIQGTNYPTGPISVNAAATDVQSALNTALSSIPGASVLVSGSTRGPWNVRFVGSLAGTPVATMTGTASGFTVSVGTTSQGGDAGRLQQVTDPRGIVSKTDYDLLGRTVRTIAAYVNFAPSAGTDQTTEYTYDGNNNVLTSQADLPGGAFQRTQYVYGINTSVISANDLLAVVRYPNKTTGLPSTSPADQESFSYNALGETTGLTDRNGTTHGYTFDVLGRLTKDAVTTLGAGVDGQILRLETAYDTGGRPYLFTSYDAASAGNVVNQVERA